MNRPCFYAAIVNLKQFPSSLQAYDFKIRKIPDVKSHLTYLCFFHAMMYL